MQVQPCLMHTEMLHKVDSAPFALLILAPMFGLGLAFLVLFFFFTLRIRETMYGCVTLLLLVSSLTSLSLSQEYSEPASASPHGPHQSQLRLAPMAPS